MGIELFDQPEVHCLHVRLVPVSPLASYRGRRTIRNSSIGVRTDFDVVSAELIGLAANRV